MLFSSANAREFAARSVQRRRELALKRFEPSAPEPLPTDSGAKETASQTLEEIRQVSGMLRRELARPLPDVERLDLLSRTKERLWKVYAHAGGVPIAAPLKQRQRRDSGTIELVPTIDLLPEPAGDQHPAVLNPENPDAADSQS